MKKTYRYRRPFKWYLDKGGKPVAAIDVAICDYLTRYIIGAGDMGTTEFEAQGYAYEALKYGVAYEGLDAAVLPHFEQLCKSGAIDFGKAN